MKKRDFLKALILPIIGGIRMNPTPSIEKQRTSTSISITPICSINVDR